MKELIIRSYLQPKPYIFLNNLSDSDAGCDAALQFTSHKSNVLSSVYRDMFLFYSTQRLSLIILNSFYVCSYI